ncbi:hypothetical protein KUTeg_000800 [Tegillarca granosa]|uniref:Uncharacterized protein n=1 Tax=Tegillarca granosa TaxID=220873 RepID=A0ABQ9FYL4_TEGGR|nr:hypothetical protein KUTeg_000800 [Tegillarca granosa]
MFLSICMTGSLSFNSFVNLLNIFQSITTLKFAQNSLALFNPIAVSLLRNASFLSSATDIVNKLVWKGLNPARQWYLYENIRDHCFYEESKEKTCPKPLAPKPEIKSELKHK